MIIKPTLFACPQKQTIFLKSFAVFSDPVCLLGPSCPRNQIRNDISCEQSVGNLVDDSYAISRSVISLKFKSVQCNLSCQIDVLRVKIKVTLCMLDKFIFLSSLSCTI